MMVSVCMITYNHEKYIKEAIEGVLMQECDFDVELIIADDCSSDNTLKVIQALQNLHPNGSRIKYTKHSINKGMMPNFIWALEKCQGKYVALCEGDDYWTDPLKLQKQVDFLEANSSFSTCFHKVRILRDNKLFDDVAIETRYDSIVELPATIDDLLIMGNFMHTPSVMFKNQNIEFPWEFSFSSVGDYFLHIINAQHGPIKRLDDVMAVYREGVGVFSSLSHADKLENILVYQTCILSYLNNDEHKKKLLEKIIHGIEKHKMNDVKQDHKPSDLILKKVLRTVKLTIKSLFKK